MSELKSFLEELKQLNDAIIFDCFIPSKQKTQKFKAFSVKQHKDLIKSVLDGVEGTVIMYKTFNDIIFENAIDEADFKLYDRNKILVDLRKQCVGEIVKINNIEYNLNDLPTFAFTYPENTTVKYKNITIEVSIPTLDTDNEITTKSIYEFNKFKSDEHKLGNSLNVLLVFEMLKFINTVAIGDTSINFSELSVYDKKTVVDNLPLCVSNDVLEYIAKYKEYEQSLLTFTDGTQLSIDASFLSIE